MIKLNFIKFKKETVYLFDRVVNFKKAMINFRKFYKLKVYLTLQNLIMINLIGFL